MSFDSRVIRPAIGDLPEIDSLEDRVAALESTPAPPVLAALDLKPDSLDIDTIRVLTQAAYDAIPSPDNRTLYLVVG